jgi:hypothetical protein
MPLDTGLDSLTTEVALQLEAIVAPPNGESLLSRNRVIRESAIHDFSRYEFMLDPTRIGYTGEEGEAGLGDLGTVGVSYETWLDFDRFVAQFRTDAQALVEGWFTESVTTWIEVDDDYVREYPLTYQERRRHIQAVMLSGHNGFRLGMAPNLYAAYTTAEDKDAFLAEAKLVVRNWLESRLSSMRNAAGQVRADDFYAIQIADFWRAGVPAVLAALAPFVPSEDEDTVQPDLGERIPANYSFDPFLPRTVNFGLQVIYRQGWVPMGTQPGEIVRTLPLGPKQSEKITVKAIVRTKSTRQSEISSSVETATESSSATKDSSEVVQEASESFNWHVEASASASFGFGSASLTAGMGGENASSSRDTKSQLNEAMQKTASKIRSDTKIIISTEQEDTREYAQESVITNPNEEIAVTYIYSRLQRQYEITTYLSEVNTVIFVAEEIPAPREIDGAWIRRYDWILTRQLLDESFREDLAIVRANTPNSAATDAGIDENIAKLMESFSGGSSPGLPDYSGLPGQVPDIFQTPQNAYEREVERDRARNATFDQYRRSLTRLRAHIYDNILHYCRAIWSAEDPDTRLMRYARIRVPTRWEFVATASPDGHLVDGYWAPASRDYATDSAPLSEMIQPMGPIGFAGNYSVYYLRPNSKWRTLEAALRFQKTPYLYFGLEVIPESGDLTAGLTLETAVSENRLDTGRYRLVVNEATTGSFQIYQENSAGVFALVATNTLHENMLQFHAVRIWFSDPALLNNGDTFFARIFTLSKLEDPELKQLRWQRQQPSTAAEERAYYTEDVLAGFAEQFADVRRSLETFDMEVTQWDGLSEVTKQTIRNRYYHFQLRQDHTRRLVIDTNNLILTREVDSSSSLEPFKGLHRLADVLKVYEELDDLRSENLRKRARLAAGRLGDPDVDKLTVVAASSELVGMAALDGLEDDPEPPVSDG